MSYELFQQGPAVYVPILLLSLVITVLAYCAIPLIFAWARKSAITRKKYRKISYIANAFVMLVFLIINGASSGAPYALWTWVFSSLGIKILAGKGLLEESEITNSINQEKVTDENTKKENIEEPSVTDEGELSDTKHNQFCLSEADEPIKPWQRNVLSEEKFRVRPGTYCENPSQSCPRCGGWIPSNSAFCPHCGGRKDMEKNSVENQEEPIRREFVKQETPITKQHKGSKTIWIIMACLLLLASIAVAIWLGIASQKVEWISERDFFYYEDYEEFVLVFELANKNGKAISSDGCLEITIVNDDGIVVYDELHSFTKDDFEKWIYPTVNNVEWLKDDVVYALYGGRQHSAKQGKKGIEKFLASIYIDPADIIPSTSSAGTVYFTVYGEDYYFEESSTEAYDLPLMVLGEGIMVRTITLSDKYTAEYIFTKMESKDFREEDVIAIMDEYGGEQGGGKAYVIEKGDFIEEVDQWCFDSDRKVGDVAIIESDYGYSICYISAIFGN